MPEPQDTNDQNTSQQQVQPGVQSQASQAASEELPLGIRPLADGRAQVLSSSAYKKLKENSFSKGKAAAAAELEQQAKSFGFTSMQDAFATLAAIKNGQGQQRTQREPKPAQQQQRQQQTRTEPQQRANPDNTDPSNQRPGGWKDSRRFEAQLDREKKARENERKLRLTEERKRKELEHQHDALQAEMAIREAAIMAGIKGKRNLTYAVLALRESVEGKSEEELSSFDETKFFEQLREEQPYLFGEVVTPVTTGTGNRNAPPAPKPGVVTTGAAQNGQVDARSMSPAQYQEHLRKRGLNPNSHGS